MISPLVNSIVISAFGFLIGAILQITMKTIPERSRRGGLPSETNKGMKAFMEGVREAQQEGVDAWKNNSTRTAMIAFYALIVVLILVIKYSPLEMNWTVFLVTALISNMIFDTIHERAKKRESSLESDSSDNSQQ